MNKGPLENTSIVPLNYRLISNLNVLIVTNKFNGENIRFAIDITIFCRTGSSKLVSLC